MTQLRHNCRVISFRSADGLLVILGSGNIVHLEGTAHVHKEYRYVLHVLASKDR